MFYNILFLLLFASFTATAQKQTYFLVAYCQKQINGICGEKIMVQQDEVSLIPTETITYRNKLLTEMRATYGKGYNNFFVELVPSGKAAIVYEFEKTYNPQKEGWDCTNKAYGVIKANDLLAAEKSFAALQAEYKKSIFKEVRRWGKPAILTPAAVGENDLAVNWKTGPTAYILNMQNTRKDVELSVTIISYKLKPGIEVAAGSEADISKMTKSGETTVVIEPGFSTQNSIPKADGFEIIIKTKPATEKEQTMSNIAKKIIRQYILDKKSKQIKENTTFGVRG